MKAVQATDRAAWEAFVAPALDGAFLQSWVWGEFQQRAGRTVHRLHVVRNDGMILAVCQAIIQEHGFGIRSCNVYRGPILSDRLSMDDWQHTYTLLNKSLLAVAHGCAFLHLEPPVGRGAPLASVLSRTPAMVPADAQQPAATSIVRLSQPAEALLAAMHEKTRYNIRLAERKGVTVVQGREPSDIEAFLRLLHVTAVRDGITPHADSYYRKMVETLGASGFASVFRAEYKGRTIASNIVFHFGSSVVYAHGASANDSRNVMAPHLLQWRQMQWALECGAKEYDLWGFAPAQAPANHPWAGITRFKLGFGGEERTYVGGFELPLRKAQYQAVRIRRKLRR